jgi:hypothetical protein
MQINGSPVQNFSLGQLRNGLVFYENQASIDVTRDNFRFQAVVKNGLAESEVTEFGIAIYPEAYWTPLTVSSSPLSLSLSEKVSSLSTYREKPVITHFIIFHSQLFTRDYKLFIFMSTGFVLMIYGSRAGISGSLTPPHVPCTLKD